MNPFDSTKATPEALEAIMRVREAYKALDALISEINKDGGIVVMGGRELALAKTNLEQSAMWAIKGISHHNIEN